MSSEKNDQKDPNERKVRGGGEPEDKKLDPELIDSVHEDLEDIEAYHGMLLEDDVAGLLPKKGDFILRLKVGADGAKEPTLTLKWDESIIDMKIHVKHLKGKEAEKEVKKRTQKSSKRKKEKKEEKDEDDDGIILYSFDNATKAFKIKELVRIHQMGKSLEHEKGQLMALNPIAKQAWELRRESIELIKKLGEGAFGEVWSGRQKLRMGKYGNVAVKVIKRSTNNERATMELQKEGSLMRKFKHDNVVRTFGMVIQRDAIMVVMELITGGGLNDYVKKNQVSMEEKAMYALDIAQGLGYIHSLNCIHRDIACRNCLIDVAKKQAKVSDFGLTRQTDCYKIQKEERIPIRWIAPEVLRTFQYTPAADTYAYGILVWELFNNGDIPFGTMTNQQIKEGIEREDFRPKFSSDVPADVTSIIFKCWKGEPAARPPFTEVVRTLLKYKKNGMDGDEKPPIQPALASNPPSSDQQPGIPKPAKNTKGESTKRRATKNQKNSKDKTKSTRKK